MPQSLTPTDMQQRHPTQPHPQPEHTQQPPKHPQLITIKHPKTPHSHSFQQNPQKSTPPPARATTTNQLTHPDTANHTTISGLPDTYDTHTQPIHPTYPPPKKHKRLTKITTWQPPQAHRAQTTNMHPPPSKRSIPKWSSPKPQQHNSTPT